VVSYPDSSQSHQAHLTWNWRTHDAFAVLRAKSNDEVLESRRGTGTSGVVTGGGGDEAVAPSGTCQKSGTLRSRNKFGLSFSVQKNGTKKVQKNYSRLFFFSLSQLKIESFFIQSV